MILLKGIIRKGQIVLPQPAELPDGTEVTVWPHDSQPTIGIPDDKWPTDPEGIARLIARMERVEPFDMSLEEEADIASWRKNVKSYTVAHQDKAIEDLFE